MFCRAVQELHRHLALAVEEEIWKGVMKDPVVASAPRAPMLQRASLQTPRVEEPVASISLEPLSASELEGAALPQDLALVPKRQPPSPSGFSLQVPKDLIIAPLEDA